MTKKYILLFNGDELETKIYTYEEVKELHSASHYYYETYGYPTFTYGETKEETIQRALDYHSYTDINQLLERNGCETFEEFKEEHIVEVKKYYFRCYEIGENELIYIEDLSNYEE